MKAIRTSSLIVILAFATGLIACGDDDDSQTPTSECEGDELSGDGIEICVYTAELVGDDFECPDAFPHPHDLKDNALACSDAEELDDDAYTLLASHGYEPADADDRPKFDGLRFCDESENLVDDHYHVYDASIDDNQQLLIDVGYSGGCEPHYWTLCWDEMFMESDPVQANLELFHDSSGDMCEAYINDTLSFDLDELRDAYETSYGGEGATVILNLVGDEKSIEYDWE